MVQGERGSDVMAPAETRPHQLRRFVFEPTGEVTSKDERASCV
jgi:hypothetical protein